jgi:general secretion pathway protein A
VGTGKTTVSRKLLQDLSDDTQAALILNPSLSAVELLATVCDELGVSYDTQNNAQKNEQKNTQNNSLKILSDKVLNKLADNHANGINTVLIIDEAQHLLPEVLEQLRLLTNLETTREKLLKIVLIGQPELQQLLRRNELRQLAQRVTARYHLLPLTKAEVALYVAHRLQVAKGSVSIFSATALSTLFQISGGIPRVINLLCDRALTLAYTLQKVEVNKNLVIAASYHVLGEDIVKQRQKDLWRPMFIGSFITSFVIGLLVGGLHA